jgi:hypothetical protein
MKSSKSPATMPLQLPSSWPPARYIPQSTPTPTSTTTIVAVAVAVAVAAVLSSSYLFSFLLGLFFSFRI